MEMVCYRLSSYLPCYATVYGNGWQAVLPLMELRSQLEIELADREEIEAELSPAEAKFCSGRQTFSEVNTRRGHNS